MTHDIIRMAREAGFTLQRDERLFTNMLARFAALVAAAEREAASERAWKALINKGADWSVRQMVSDAIRARGNT